MLRLLDTLDLAIRVDVFNLANKIAEGLVLTACAVANWRIATAHCDFNHNHVQGDGDGAFFDAPST
jgi:hypothetical protein